MRRIIKEPDLSTTLLRTVGRSMNRRKGGRRAETRTSGNACTGKSLQVRFADPGLNGKGPSSVVVRSRGQMCGWSNTGRAGCHVPGHRIQKGLAVNWSKGTEGDIGTAKSGQKLGNRLTWPRGGGKGKQDPRSLSGARLGNRR